jgi:small membrane protein
MSGIQLILLTGIAFIGLYFLLQLKKRSLDIILLFLMVACAVVFILWPGVTNTIAKWIGVGRGADLIFYVSILIFWFISLKLYARIRKLEQQFTKIVREDALKKAQDLQNRP